MNEYTAEYYMKMSEKVFAPIYPYLASAIISRVAHDTNKLKVIDLGGGNGKWLLTMLTEGIKYGTLIDASPEMIEYAKIKLEANCATKNWQAILGDASSIPLESESHNLIISRSSMHMWEDIQLCWQEMHRVLTPSGYAFLGRGYGPDLPDEIRSKVKATRKALRNPNKVHKEEPPSLEPNELISIAQKAGFTKTEIIPDAKAYWILAKK